MITLLLAAAIALTAPENGVEMDKAEEYAIYYAYAEVFFDEECDRVHFQKGRNRILLRCENGHWNVGWSLCVATGDGLSEL